MSDGGTGDIRGDGNVTVTDPRERVQVGDINIGLDAIGALAEQVPRRRPVSADRLDWLAKRFVAPGGPAYQEAQAMLTTPGTVVISGEPGAGRHTAGLMLLHNSGSGTTSFQELAVTENHELEPASRTVQEDERLLLDLTAFGRHDLDEIKRAVETFRADVERRAYLVIVVSAAHRRTWGADLGPELTIGCPDRRAVLQSHLDAQEVPLPPEVWVMGELSKYLRAGRMNDLADLAQQVRVARDRLAGRGGPREWVHAAVQVLADQREAARKRVNDAGDGQAKALLFTTSMLQGASADEIFHSERRLLATVKYPDQGTHLLDERDFTQRLLDIGVQVEENGRPTIKDLGLDAALRTYFWSSMPGLRSAFRAWVDRVVSSHEVLGLHKRLLVERFAEQALAMGDVEHIFLLVQRWTRAELPVHSHFTTLADTLLQLGLLHERQGQGFRRRFYQWAAQPTTPTSLAQLVITLTVEVVAPTHADQAVVRLHHLTRHNDDGVRSSAVDALVQLAQAPRFWRRVLHRLCGNTDAAVRFTAMDRAAFARLADVESVFAPRVVLDRGQVHEELTAGCRALLVEPDASTHRLVEQWLGARNPVLREILVTATAGDPALLGRLHGIGRRWRLSAASESDERAARDVVVGDLRMAIDRALGLAFLESDAESEDTAR